MCGRWPSELAGWPLRRVRRRPAWARGAQSGRTRSLLQPIRRGITTQRWGCGHQKERSLDGILSGSITHDCSHDMRASPTGRGMVVVHTWLLAALLTRHGSLNSSQERPRSWSLSPPVITGSNWWRPIAAHRCFPRSRSLIGWQTTLITRDRIIRSCSAPMAGSSWSTTGFAPSSRWRPPDSKVKMPSGRTGL